MLADTPLIAIIPTLNATRARDFYQQTLGLIYLGEDTFAVIMDSCGTMLRITRVPALTPHPFAILGWQVEDIDDAVAELTAKGVEFIRYPYLQQSETGVWTAPGNSTRVAWFQDPDGNTLSLTQH